MNFSVTIKAGSITNLTEARYYAAQEVDYVGFCMDPENPSFMPINQVKEIKEWIIGPKIVGEFGAQSWSFITDKVHELGLDAVQIKLNYTELPNRMFEVFQEVTGNELFNSVDFYIASPALTENIPTSKLFIQADSQEVYHSAIQQHQPLGINILGTKEEKVGIMDFDAAADLLESLELE